MGKTSTGTPIWKWRKKPDSSSENDTRRDENAVSFIGVAPTVRHPGDAHVSLPSKPDGSISKRS